MGNKQATPSPFPSYEQATSLFTANELTAQRQRFHSLSGETEFINLEAFAKLPAFANLDYMRKSIVPRLLATCDLKKDGVLDIEEYTCSMALFRFGSLEDKCKLLFGMYDAAKTGGCLNKDSLRQLLVDATVCLQKQDASLGNLETWIAGLKPLSEAMVESALLQYSLSGAQRLDLTEFLCFLKVESTLQGMLARLPCLLGDDPLQ